MAAPFFIALSSPIWMLLSYLVLRKLELQRTHAVFVLSSLGVTLLVLLQISLPDCSVLEKGEFYICQENGMVAGLGQLVVIASFLLTGFASGAGRLWSGAS